MYTTQSDEANSNESSPGKSLSSGAQDTSLAGRAGHILAQCAQWLKRTRLRERQAPRLALVERIALAPRQTLALVEAEGRRLLVAISADGSPAFLALDSEDQLRPRRLQNANKSPSSRTPKPTNSGTRVSW
jgi:hypothetical protein